MTNDEWRKGPLLSSFDIRPSSFDSRLPLLAPDVPVRVDVDPVAGGDALVLVVVGGLEGAPVAEVAVALAVLLHLDLAQQPGVLAADARPGRHRVGQRLV